MDNKQMKPIFFPFTSISKPVLENLMTCFKQVVLYLPSSRSVDPEMTELSKINMFDLRIPVETDEDKLSALYQDYLSWADLHEKDRMTSLKSRKTAPPLFDSTWTAQIKSDIQNYSKSKTGKAPDPEFNARLFLKIAQEHDRHHFEMNQDIQSIKKMEQNLFKELKGEEPDPYHNRSNAALYDSTDIGAHMTHERISSWCRIMRHDANLPSGVFITTSAAVWEHIMDSSPEAQIVENNIPMKDAGSPSENRVETLSRYLDNLQREKWSSTNLEQNEFIQNEMFNDQISLKISIIPDQTPYHYFSRFISRQGMEMEQVPCPSIFPNTILGLLTWM